MKDYLLEISVYAGFGVVCLIIYGLVMPYLEKGIAKYEKMKREENK